MNAKGERGGQAGAPRRSALFVATAATLAWMVGAPALAQQTEPRTAEDPVDLGVVVVTANKRVQNIREVGAAISLIDERMLENLGANSLSDYADYVPGLQVQDNGTPGLTSVSMRGIAALSSGATVASYIDEIPVGSSGIYQAATTLNLDLLPYDIERIEVLRGPQGTLYGAGAIGGLLKYVTREPDPLATQFRVGAGLANVHSGNTGWNARFGANLPLADERMAVRVGYARNELPAYIDNQFDGREDINRGTQASSRIALAWTGDRFGLRLSALRQEIDVEDQAGVALDPATGRPLFGDLTDRFLARQPFTKDIDLYALTLDWDLGWADVVSATGWTDTRTMYQLDSSVQFGEIADLLLGLPGPGSSRVRYDLDLDKFTQEFRLSSKSGGPFEWMVGAFHTKEKALQEQLAWLGSLDGSPLPPPLDEMFGTLALVQLPSDYRETAVFVNGSWQVTERFKVDAGLRQARNEQDFSQIVPAGILVELGTTPGSSSEDVFTWNLSPQFRISDEAMVYARVATGYQPGGPNVALPGIPPSVDSSMLSSYEIGLKAQTVDRRAQVDLAVFRIDWDDIQVQSQFNGVGGLVNGGEATSEGVELSALFRPTGNLQFGLNAAYTRAAVKNDFEPTVIPQDGFDVILNSGLDGDRMPYVPRLAWSATADYYFDLPGAWSGQVGAAFRHVGGRAADTSERQRITLPGDPSSVLDETLTPPLQVDGYRSIDLHASVGNDNWSIRAYVNNATDKRGWSSMSRIDGALSGTLAQLRAVPIQPRTFGVEFDYRF